MPTFQPRDGAVPFPRRGRRFKKLCDEFGGDNFISTHAADSHVVRT